MRATIRRPQAKKPPRQLPQVLGLIFLSLAFIVALIATFAFGGSTETKPVADVAGPDKTAAEGCRLINGYQVCDFPDGPQILKFYLDTQEILGKPLSSFQPTHQPPRQIFMNGVATYNASAQDGWKVQLELLGDKDRRNTGNVPEDRFAPVQPAVGAYLNDLERRGVDIGRFFGPTISQTHCRAGNCNQWSERMRFEFPEGASARDQVRLTSLGVREAGRLETKVVPVYRNLPLIAGLLFAIVFLVCAILLLRIASVQRTKANKATRGRLQGRRI